MVSATRKHFNRRSGHYTKSSESLLWRWQRGRETSAVDFLIENVAGDGVLDLGCGAGHYTRHFLKRGTSHVTAVDFSPSMISQLPKSNVTGIVEDATKIRLETKFSMIICAGLLEFVSVPGDVLGSARDLITNDGWMVCIVPPDNWAGRFYRAYHRRHDIEINLFTQGTFKRLCTDTGWMVDAYRFVYPYTDVYRLTPRQTV